MLDQALLDPLLSPAFLGLVGLCVGSFLNVVIYRLPVMLHREWLSDCADQLAIESDLRTHAGLDEAAASAQEIAKFLSQWVVAESCAGPSSAWACALRCLRALREVLRHRPCRRQKPS